MITAYSKKWNMKASQYSEGIHIMISILSDLSMCRSSTGSLFSTLVSPASPAECIQTTVSSSQVLFTSDYMSTKVHCSFLWLSFSVFDLYIMFVLARLQPPALWQILHATDSDEW
jgi:hypothetical protein